MEASTNLVEGVITANAAKFAMEFAQKRADLKAKALRGKTEVPSATDLAKERITFEQTKGKTLWGQLHEELTGSHYNPMLLLTTPTPALQTEDLRSFVKSVWPPAPSLS
ncbi:hypothetical protein ACVW1A_006322 [Bradyrhizobium sp. LB1.3]